MPTPPKQWPLNAQRARDDAARAAVKGTRTLGPLVNGDNVSDVERERRIGKAWGLFQFIARVLEGVGAPTRPELEKDDRE